MNSALVTGGTIRLGGAISGRLRARGWRVIVSSHRADAGADVVCDLSRAGAADTLYSRAVELAGGRLDAIVNNAALFTGDDAALEAVNFAAPKRLTELIAERGEGRGSVVNVVDLHVRDDVYGRTKRDLVDFTRRSALRYAGVLRVNAVAPGPVLAPTAVRAKAGGMPLPNRPTPDDVAEAVAFLLEAQAVTGVVLPVDSGQHLLEMS